ncbi:unnamed protein product [Linum trigynum]|uniref:Uncharacterized protein n=1 Tax=Linum trigynum TaxID=586398 RepID=A0AAV2CKG5_9ROSI
MEEAIRALTTQMEMMMQEQATQEARMDAQLDASQARLKAPEMKESQRNQAMTDPKYTEELNEYVERRKKIVDPGLWNDMQKSLAALKLALLKEETLSKPTGFHEPCVV